MSRTLVFDRQAMLLLRSEQRVRRISRIAEQRIARTSALSDSSSSASAQGAGRLDVDLLGDERFLLLSLGFFGCLRMTDAVRVKHRSRQFGESANGPAAAADSSINASKNLPNWRWHGAIESRSAPRLRRPGGSFELVS